MTASTDIFRDVELDESLEHMLSALDANLTRVKGIRDWGVTWPAEPVEQNAAMILGDLAALRQALAGVTMRIGPVPAGKMLVRLERALARLRWLVQWGEDHHAADMTVAARHAISVLAVVGVHLELHQSGS
ncbi:MAG: hypothetical protein IT442_05005 [Phycisphaeraceae bacterium]|nr:hypothetical protein [Phycisphaeraceae bacterium]